MTWGDFVPPPWVATVCLYVGVLDVVCLYVSCAVMRSRFNAMTDAFRANHKNTTDRLREIRDVGWEAKDAAVEAKTAAEALKGPRAPSPSRTSQGF